MPAVAVTSQAPYVPGDVFRALTPHEQEEARRRILKFTLGHTKGSTVLVSEDEREELVHNGVKWMLRVESCEYLEGQNGIDTIVGLACHGVIYAYLQIRRQRGNLPLHVEYVEDTTLASGESDDGQHDQNSSARRASAGQASSDRPLVEEREEGSELLQSWFSAQINGWVGITEETRQHLLRVIGLVFDPKAYEDLYTFTDGHLGLKAESISKHLGLKANWVSKHAAKILNEILAAARPEQSNLESVR